MKREKERTESLRLTIEAYLLKYDQPGFNNDDLLRECAMQAALHPDTFLEEVNRVRMSV